MVARSVGFKGAEFSQLKARLCPEDAKTYRAASELWKDLVRDFFKALYLTESTMGFTPRPVKMAKRRAGARLLWAAHQRFFRQLLMCFKVPHVLEEVKRALAEGLCVVVGMQTTGESSLTQFVEDVAGAAAAGGNEDADEENGEDYLDEGVVGGGAGKNTEVVSVCRNIVANFLRKHFPVERAWSLLPGEPLETPYKVDKWDLVMELEHVSRTVPCLDRRMFVRRVFDFVYVKPTLTDRVAFRSNGIVVEAERLKERLTWRLAMLPLPPSALDDLVDRVGGPTVVAELTGRTHRQVRLEDSTVVVERRTAAAAGAKPPSKSKPAEIREAMDTVNNKEKKAFMRGEKLVAIISDAASTGISLHAERNKENQRRRVHITWELPWSADRAIQQLGRSHRTNQTSAPVFKLLTTGLGGEHRFVSSVCKRLKQLGALTQGDRRASVGAMAFQSEGEVDPTSKHAVVALRAVYLTAAQRVVCARVNWKAVVAECADLLELDVNAGGGEGAGRGGQNKWCAACVPQTLDEFLDMVVEAVGHICGGQPCHAPAPETTARILGARANARTSASATDVLGEMAHQIEQRRLGGLIVLDGASPAAGEAEAATKPKYVANDCEFDLKVERFLNRMLGLPVSHQSLLFAYFAACLRAVENHAKQTGTFEGFATRLTGRSLIRKQPDELLFEDHKTGGKVFAVVLERDRGCTLEEMLREVLYAHAVREGQAGATRDSFAVPATANAQLVEAILQKSAGGVYVAKRVMGGVQCVVLAEKFVQGDAFKIIRPSTGVYDSTMMDAESLQANYTKLDDPARIMNLWNAEFYIMATQCMHGNGCAIGPRCEMRKRLLQTGLLMGSVVPLWKMLAGCINPRDPKHVNVVHAELTTAKKESLIGVHVPLHLMGQVRSIMHEVHMQRNGISVRNLKLTFPARLQVPARVKGIFMAQTSPEQQEAQRVFDKWLHSKWDDYASELYALVGFSLNENNEVVAVDSHRLPTVKVGCSLDSVAGCKLSKREQFRSLFVHYVKEQVSTVNNVTTIRFFTASEFVFVRTARMAGAHNFVVEPVTPVNREALARLVVSPKLSGSGSGSTLSVAKTPSTDSLASVAIVAASAPKRKPSASRVKRAFFRRVADDEDEEDSETEEKVSHAKKRKHPRKAFLQKGAMDDSDDDSGDDEFIVDDDSDEDEEDSGGDDEVDSDSESEAEATVRSRTSSSLASLSEDDGRPNRNRTQKRPLKKKDVSDSDSDSDEDEEEPEPPPRKAARGVRPPPRRKLRVAESSSDEEEEEMVKPQPTEEEVVWMTDEDEL